jgi:hypothetical protein
MQRNKQVNVLGESHGAFISALMIYFSTGYHPNQALEQPNSQTSWYRDIPRTIPLA